jgi:hypothetical protein
MRADDGRKLDRRILEPLRLRATDQVACGVPAAEVGAGPAALGQHRRTLCSPRSLRSGTVLSFLTSNSHQLTEAVGVAGEGFSESSGISVAAPARRLPSGGTRHSLAQGA